MSTTCNGNRDTVEEFWNKPVLQECFEHASQVEPTDFLNRLRQYLGTAGTIWAFPRAKLALQQFLSDTAVPRRNTVLLCSYNCPAVADAVHQAGLQVETFDLTEPSGRIDWDAVANILRPHHHALVVPHLFGVPTDFRPIYTSARQNGVLIIEDCAMTLGGKLDSVVAGTLGDAAIFSFNYDKPLSLGGGGALLVNNEGLISKIQPPILGCELTREREELRLFTRCLQRRRERIRQIALLNQISERVLIRMGLHPTLASSPVSGIGSLRAALGLWQLERFPEVLKQRNHNANMFSQDHISVSWHVGPDVTPAWLKQKAVPTRPHDAQKISHYLQQHGLRVGLFNWPTTLDKYLGFSEKPNAYYASKYCLDIPIHQSMTTDELEVIRHALWD